MSDRQDDLLTAGVSVRPVAAVCGFRGQTVISVSSVPDIAGRLHVVQGRIDSEQSAACVAAAAPDVAMLPVAVPETVRSAAEASLGGVAAQQFVLQEVEVRELLPLDYFFFDPCRTVS